MIVVSKTYSYLQWETNAWCLLWGIGWGQGILHCGVRVGYRGGGVRGKFMDEVRVRCVMGVGKRPSQDEVQGRSGFSSWVGSGWWSGRG